jgi:protein-tyrosine phosphatase
VFIYINIFLYLDSAIWEREPNRKLKILTDSSLLQDENDYREELHKIGREIELFTNSEIFKLDVNFVSHLKFDRIGDFNIFIGPYPQNEDDIENLSKNKVSAVLNVQTDLDLIHRQVNWNANLKAYEKYNIQIVRYPIRDFDQSDLISKLKGAADELRDLLNDDNLVYVHCTAGMSRAAATVIAYMVFYQNYSLEEAYEYVKSYRNIICPNLNAISEVIKANS